MSLKPMEPIHPSQNRFENYSKISGISCHEKSLLNHFNQLIVRIAYRFGL